MSKEEIIRLLFSLLGGGIVVAILNWIRLNRAELRERKINFLRLKLEKLYGPLYYFVCQCEKLFELNKRWDNVYCKEYIGKKWSKDYNTQEAISKEADCVIELRNTYIAEVEKNSENIKEILNNNYPYIDHDDINTFTLFYEHYIRRKIELDNEKKLKPPIKCYQDVGNISFLRPEFIARVKEKFTQKKKELEKLCGNKMDFKIKKIIAREGLIVIGILFIVGLSEMIGYLSFRRGGINFWLLPDQPPNTAIWKQMNAIFLICVYPFYLIIRFIVWATKTLKQNMQEKEFS